MKKSTNILELLKKDHRRIQTLCARVKSESKKSTRTAANTFRELAELVDKHSHAEENALYDRLKKGPSKTKALAFEGYEEHHVADVLIKELKELHASKDRWMAKFEVLKEALEHHIEEEESEMFAKARTFLSKSELEMAGGEFLDAKNGEVTLPLGIDMGITPLTGPGVIL